MKKPIGVDDLWKVQRIGAIAASPDGAQVACAVTSYSMQENQGSTQLWLLSTLGGAPRQLTTCGEKDGAPAWSPDGQCIAFTAKREHGGEKDKTAQLYLIRADGGEARRIGHSAPGTGASRWLPGVEAFRWMPGGKRLIFVAWVWPELKGAAAQNKRQREFDQRKESGHATSEGQYRYWSQNLPLGRVAHLLTIDVGSGKVADLFEGSDFELPRDEPDLANFDISPDGRRVLFTFDPAAKKAGGNRCVLVELELRTKRFTTIAEHTAWDFIGPRYSRDGDHIAAVAANTGRRHTAFGQLALWPSSRAFKPRDARAWTHDVLPPLHWSAGGEAIAFSAEEQGRCHAWRHELASRSFTPIARGGWVQALDLAGAPGVETLVTLMDSAMHPAQVHAHRDGRSLRLESFNDKLMQRLDLGRVDEHRVQGALGEPVQLWVVQPRRWNAKKKHPVLQVIHGGPYTASGDSFSYRWNAHLLASRGHVAVLTNYHGSSGFGEDFRHSIMGRQGQLELQDLQAATDWILAQPWADPSRIYAAGASYGGYLVAWMNGHWKPWPEGPIRACVCHAGVFDRIATWSADSYTQRYRDLGATYWQDRAKVESQSPHTFAGAMRTPTLVIHGALDYRVPDHNGLAYYNTLKVRGVDARLLWFPDENHWVLKPRNSKQWVGEFFGWLERHGGAA